MRRIGNEVIVHIPTLNPAAATVNTLYSLDVGFSAVHSNSITGSAIDTTTLAPIAAYIASTTNVAVNRLAISAGNTARVTFQFTTAQAWPTTLPGTASGSIPTA
jgi:hypothetical protein